MVQDTPQQDKVNPDVWSSLVFGKFLPSPRDRILSVVGKITGSSDLESKMHLLMAQTTRVTAPSCFSQLIGQALSSRCRP